MIPAIAYFAAAVFAQEGAKPSRTEAVKPIRNATFDKGGKAKIKKMKPNPRTAKGVLMFDGADDGDRQVDPQIAVGGGFVFHGTNSGLYIYTKAGEFVSGVRQSAFNDGIDPKLFYDPHNKIFGFDLWWYYDKEKKKPVNVSISETSDPRGAWNTYPVSAANGVDGGAIGFSRQWIGYSFPGGDERTFVIKTSEAKSGKPATVYHFKGSLGHPVNTQDELDDIHFVELSRNDIVVTRVGDSGDGTPAVKSVVKKPHGFQHFGSPPQSPQKGTDKKTASGDRNPKNIVIQNGCIWFSQAVAIDKRSAVQWHQFKLDGTKVQSGRIAHEKNSYIQTSLAVNANEDVLIGFQETGPDMFISPRAAIRKKSDPPGKTQPIVKLGEGKAATKGGPWGDYSGSVRDGDNLSDLWTIQSIADKDGKGDTVIARFKVETNRKTTGDSAAKERGRTSLRNRDYDRAIAEFTTAAASIPNDATVFLSRGDAWNRKKAFDKAIADYRQAVRIDPTYANPHNNIAWLRATTPDPKILDGKAAVEHALKAVELTNRKSADYLDTLAAAYAEAGRFDEAVKEQAAVIELLRSDKKVDAKEIEDAKARLDLYRNRKPYRLIRD
jgi:tetratricopeptide (TPR) repeat protein